MTTAMTDEAINLAASSRSVESNERYLEERLVE